MTLHDELCEAGKKWLIKSIGARLAISELVCNTTYGEIPDVIGWKSGYSILIEAKTSRSDFQADKKKIFRQYPEYGMGTYRLFLCPDGLIKPEELPDSWGLLYYHPDKKKRKIERIECFKGNIIMESGRLKGQITNFEAERNILLSYTCRV